MTTRTGNPLGAKATLPVPRSFLDGLRLDHGPIADIGKFLLATDAAVQSIGITLSFAPISELVALQAANEASWYAFQPTLNARYATLDDSNSYCLLGRDRSGRVVAAQAGRIYPLGPDKSLQSITDDQTIFYDTPRHPALDEPRAVLTAPSAKLITGTLVYSGALWVAPDYRGHKLAAILPRISRAYALGRYNTDITFCFVSDQIADSPLFSMYGYRRREPRYTIWMDGKPWYQASLLWMDRDELVADMAAFRSGLVSEIDGAVGRRGGHNDIRAVS